MCDSHIMQRVGFVSSKTKGIPSETPIRGCVHASFILKKCAVHHDKWLNAVLGREQLLETGDHSRRALSGVESARVVKIDERLSLEFVAMSIRHAVVESFPLVGEDVRCGCFSLRKIGHLIVGGGLARAPTPTVVHQSKTNPATDVIEGGYCFLDELVTADQIRPVRIEQKKGEPCPARIEKLSTPPARVLRVMEPCCHSVVGKKSVLSLH